MCRALSQVAQGRARPPPPGLLALQAAPGRSGRTRVVEVAMSGNAGPGWSCRQGPRQQRRGKKPSDRGSPVWQAGLSAARACTDVCERSSSLGAQFNPAARSLKCPAAHSKQYPSGKMKKTRRVQECSKGANNWRLQGMTLQQTKIILNFLLFIF